MSIAAPSRVVLDTNVLRAALWSSSGASFKLLRALPHPAVVSLLSVPLYLEYQSVLTRTDQLPPGVESARILGFLRQFAAMAELREIYFLWRPFLPDASDDMLLELAVTGRATHIVNFNLSDFAGTDRTFGIQAVTPGQILASLPPSA